MRQSEYRLEHEEGKIICAFHNAQVVSFISCVVIGCQPRSGYANMHICWPAHWHFRLLADASRAAKPVSVVYYFLLCVRAVGSSAHRPQIDYSICFSKFVTHLQT